MGGIKRKTETTAQTESKSKSKKIKVDKSSTKRPAKADAVKPTKISKKAKVQENAEELIESDTSEEENGFHGVSAKKVAGPAIPEDEDVEMEGSASSDDSSPKKQMKKIGSTQKGNVALMEEQKAALAGLNATSSREAHAKQKALAKERKAGKPNADIIERSKKLWEKLRLKSHVEKEERQKLVAELFEIVTGRVKDFVFKHDSARVVQCAIKYSTMEQRRMIARELKGEYKTLAEGKYAKFLTAKLLEKGDPEIRDMIVTEFYGHVRRLINHPEAAWILDDTYRQVATTEQKARLLREWYGPEFSIKGLKATDTDTAELSVILEKSPEKRKPIMEHLEIQINQLIQKKLIGFTMLHDAMLQYFLCCKPGSEEANAFLEHFKPDPTLKEGEEADNVDLLKNLAFTKSGSRLVSLALAYGTAKDRKALLKPYKDTVEMMSYDANAHHVLLAALAVVDDTKLTSKTIFGELLPSNDSLSEKVLNLANDAHARTVILYPFASDAKWLFNDPTRERLSELYAIRSATSKKDPNTRQQEITKTIVPQLFTAITARAAEIAASHSGLQFMGEALVGAPGVETDKRNEALTEVAQIAQQIIDSSLPVSAGDAKAASQGKNMLKTLVQGGKFDPKLKKVVPVEPPLGFADLFWDQIKDNVLQWATGQGSFVIVGLAEAEGFGKKDGLMKALEKGQNELKAAAESSAEEPKTSKKIGKASKKGDKAQGEKKGNAGARILLEKL
ncbi:armadillo-type protein [Massariosphaeria phaeospora]|uniref:Armadillo-type protein n=1 Tax=Massariosphaeria phaeospora TaxID=100035 RepID=A0A7C8I351_9PLEO|nr:armadillo-type protein [Massariosphaeria phaeospora]